MFAQTYLEVYSRLVRKSAIVWKKRNGFSVNRRKSVFVLKKVRTSSYFVKR